MYDCVTCVYKKACFRMQPCLKCLMDEAAFSRYIKGECKVDCANDCVRYNPDETTECTECTEFSLFTDKAPEKSKYKEYSLITGAKNCTSCSSIEKFVTEYPCSECRISGELIFSKWEQMKGTMNNAK